MQKYIWVCLLCACLGWQCSDPASLSNSNSKALTIASKSLSGASAPVEAEMIGLLQYFKGYAEENKSHEAVYSTARDIHGTVKEFSLFINQLSNVLIEESGGRYPEDFSDRALAGLPKGGENISTGRRILVQERDNNQLSDKVETVREDLVMILKDFARIGLEGFYFSEYDVDPFRSQMPLKDIGYSWSYGNADSWEEYQFAGKSVNTCLAKLRNINNNALLSGKMALEFLKDKINTKSTVSYDAYTLMSEPTKACVSVGETFKTKITLVNYASYAFAYGEVDGKKTYFEGGQLKYSTKAKEVGTVNETLKIFLYNNTTGKYDTLNQAFSYEVVE